MAFSADGINSIKPFQYEQGNKSSGVQNDEWDEPIIKSNEKTDSDISSIENEFAELYEELAMANNEEDRFAIHAEIAALGREYEAEQANQELETIITNSGLPPELQNEVLALVGDLDGASAADRDSIMAEIQLRIAQSDTENKDEILLSIEKYSIGVAYSNDIRELYEELAQADASDRDLINAEIQQLELRHEQEMQEIAFKEQNLEEIRGFQAIVENSGLPEELQGDVMGLIDELKDASPDERDAIIAKICALAARSGYEGFEGSEEFISNIQTYNMELNYKHELQGLYDALAQADADDRDRIQAEIEALEFRHQMETESNMFE